MGEASRAAGHGPLCSLLLLYWESKLNLPTTVPDSLVPLVKSSLKMLPDSHPLPTPTTMRGKSMTMRVIELFILSLLSDSSSRWQ